MRHRDSLGALELAGAGVGASAEAEFVHLCDHCLCTALSLRTALGQEGEGTNASCYEQHCRAVLAGCYAGAATYARGGVHTFLGFVVRNEDVVGVLGGSGTDGYESACLENLVERATVYDKVFDYGECGTPPRLHRDGSAVFEMAHKELAGGDVVVRTVGAAVYIEGTRTADTLAAVMVESDGTAALAALLYGHRVAALADKLLVKDIKHL